MSRKAFVVLVLSTLLLGPGLGIGAERTQGVWQTSQHPVVVSLRPVLKDAGKVARLSYVGTCLRDGSPFPLQIPEIELLPPPTGETGLTAVSAMFRNHNHVVVTEDTPGIIRIRIGEFPDAIMQTKISRLSLEPLEQYVTYRALYAVLRNEDMNGAVRKFGLGVGVTLFNDLLPALTPDLPHLPSSMSDVTASQVFDMVATTFGGIVVSGVCPEFGAFEVDFAYLG